MYIFPIVLQKRGEFMKNEADVKSAFKKKYDYLTADEISTVYDVAVKTYLDVAFPFNAEIISIPEDRPRAWAWVYDCMGEILEKSGCSSMTAYSENGVSISWDKSGVSRSLLNRVVPKVGIL